MRLTGEKRRPVLGADVEPAALAGVPRRTLPDFLGIGVQKAGTTWLYENLRRHPELYLPPEKELHFFDRPAGRTLVDYARRFSAARGRVKGEITPAYASLPRSTIRLIRAVMPDVRLVLLLRDPVERAWSQLVMELCRRGGHDPARLPRREVRAFLRSPASTSRSRYVPMLDAWGESFGDGSLHVAFYDDVVHRPRRLLRGVFRHLGVSTRVDWDAFLARRVIVPNVRGGLRSGRFARVVAPSRLDAETSPPCPDWIARLLAAELDAELRELSRRFGEPVKTWRARWRHR